jgi:hypothetical protein
MMLQPVSGRSNGASSAKRYLRVRSYGLEVELLQTMSQTSWCMDWLYTGGQHYHVPQNGRRRARSTDPAANVDHEQPDGQMTRKEVQVGTRASLRRLTCNG